MSARNIPFASGSGFGALQPYLDRYAGYVAGIGVSIMAAAIVVLTEIDAQSGRVLDAEGHGWNFSVLFGPTGVLNGLAGHGWTVLTAVPLPATETEKLITLMAAYLGLGTFLVGVYALLMLATLWAVTSSGRWRFVGIVAVAGAVLTDLAENLWAWLLITDTINVTGPLVLATGAKWLFWIGGLGVIVLRLVIPYPREAEGRVLGRDEKPLLDRSFLACVWRAVRHHRFSFVPLVPLAVLTVLSGSAILEQLPDIQRRWVSDGSRGVWHALFAFAAIAAVAGSIFMLGRYRTGFARRLAEECEAERASLANRPETAAAAEATRTLGYRFNNLWVWVAIWGFVLGYLLLGLLTVLPVRFDLILGWRLAVFLLVPAVVVVASRLIRRSWRQNPHWIPQDKATQIEQAEIPTFAFVGHVAAICVVVVGGLGLLRSFAPLVVLPPGVADFPALPVWALITAGALAVVLPWAVVVAGLEVRRRERRELRRPALSVAQPRRRWSVLARVADLGQRQPHTITSRIAWLSATVGLFVLLAVLPQIGRLIGVTATATIAIGALTGMVATAGLVVQERPTAELFRLFRLQRTPLVSLLAVTIALVGAFGGANSIHGIDRGRPGAAPSDRPTMQAAFDQWVADPDGCELVVEGRRVRPMIMVAAEGGGIRAAYWTVKGLEAIEQRTGCGAQSTLFSGGASGGAVGLAVSRFSGTADAPGGAAAVEAVRQMAEPPTLAEATVGTFIRDIAYGATGLPIGRVGAADPTAWVDRARLIENGWGQAHSPGAIAWGEQDFLGDQSRSPLPGHLILNSSSVRNGCRVWVSQVNLESVTDPAADEEPVFDAEKSCDSSPSVGVRTIDLFSAYGSAQPDATGECIGNLSAKTAALLTARFPYVTPSGVVGPCPGAGRRGQPNQPYWPRAQLVDGGYIENTGLATVTDLSPEWLTAVREHNGRALDRPEQPLVVPMVVFLTNDDRKVTQPALNQAPSSEFAVPLVTILKGRGTLSTTEAMLERARTAVDLDGFCPTGDPVCQQLDDHFPSRVIVVDRVTQPDVAAPLGWVLSDASMDALDTAMTHQVETTCTANAPGPVVAATSEVDLREPSCRDRYATLGDLIRYYQSGQPAR